MPEETSTIDNKFTGPRSPSGGRPTEWPTEPPTILNRLTGPISERGEKILFLIVALGLLIRLLAAWLQPAFLDEGFVFHLTRSGLASTIHMLKIDAHPPTFNIIMYPLIQATDSIFLLRLPEVLLSLLTIVLSFQLSRRFLEEPLALAATAFVALSYNIWLTDAQLRTYGPITLGFTLIWIGMFDIYRDGRPFSVLLPTRRRFIKEFSCGLGHYELDTRMGSSWILFTVIACGCASLHYLSVMVIFACFLMALALPSDTREYTRISLILSVIPVGIWLFWSRATCDFIFPVSPAGFSQRHWQAFFSSPAAICNWELSGLPNLCTDSLFGPALEVIFPILTEVLTGLLWIFFLLGWYRLAHEPSSEDVHSSEDERSSEDDMPQYRTRRWEANLLGLSTLLPISLLFLACVMGKLQYTQNRYAIPMSLPFILLSAQAFSASGRKRFLGCLLGLTVLLCVLFPFMPQLWNQNWQGTVNFIDKNHRPNDLIAIYNPYAGYSFAMAYDPEHTSFHFTDKYMVELVQKPDPAKAPLLLISQDILGPELLHDMRGYRLILVLCQEKFFLESATILRWLADYYEIVDSYHEPSLRSWADTSTYILERKPQDH